MMRKIVCLDFDGVLARSDGWQGVEHIGEPIPGAAEFTKVLSEFADVVIHTCRMNPELSRGVSVEFAKRRLREWLDKHGFAYVDVWTGQGKPIAAAYVDDRAVAINPQALSGAAGEYALAIECVKSLCGAD